MKRTQITLILAIGLMTALLAIGCGSEEKPKTEKGLIGRVVDTVADGFAQTLNDARLDTSEEATADATLATNVAATENTVTTEGGVADLIISDSTVYSIYDDGLAVYDLRTKERTDIATDDRPSAIVEHNGEIFVGVGSLYKIVDGTLEPADGSYFGNITALASLNYRLIIGTDEGVFTRSIFGDETLVEDVVVSALAPDVDGVWIGTDGQGLFRWDGRQVNKRWLERDEALFDFVNALDYRHSHLYLGTDAGLFIYDGGAWAQLTAADGLPGEQVRKIDAASWVVYLVTDGGFVGYFDDEFIPQDKFADYSVTVARRYGSDLIVGTADGYLLKKSGVGINTLIEPDEVFVADLLSKATE